MVKKEKHLLERAWGPSGWLILPEPGKGHWFITKFNWAYDFWRASTHKKTGIHIKVA